MGGPRGGPDYPKPTSLTLNGQPRGGQQTRLPYICKATPTLQKLCHRTRTRAASRPRGPAFGDKAWRRAHGHKIGTSKSRLCTRRRAPSHGSRTPQPSATKLDDELAGTEFEHRDPVTALGSDLGGELLATEFEFQIPPIALGDDLGNEARRRTPGHGVPIARVAICFLFA